MPSINTHKAKDGSITYRVRVRMTGQPLQTASFSSLKDAKRYATMIEGQMIEGRQFPQKKSQHTLLELLQRYDAEIMPRKTPETQRRDGYVLTYWQKRLGYKRLADVTK